MPTTRWVKFLGSHDLPRFIKEGQVCSMKIEERRICIAHRADGYFAMNDSCPHAGASLGMGWCDKDGYVVCPVHRIKFNPTNGRTVTGEGYYVPHYLVEEREDGLYIGFEVKDAWWKFW